LVGWFCPFGFAFWFSFFQARAIAGQELP
jgi:hypothetical protein